MIRLLLITLTLAGLGLLAACNTFQGMGQDSKETWDWMSGTPAPLAYDQITRDF